MSAHGLRGRVVLVTGVSRRSGIGAGIAKRLVAEGASVMLHSWARHDETQPWGGDSGGVDALLAELRDAGGRVDHRSADFADPAAPATLIEAAIGVFGRLDVLVANHVRSSSQSLEQLSSDEVDTTMAVNVRATLLLVQGFATHHQRPSEGRVILFTSGQYHTAMPAELPYIASKAALRELTPSLAVHLAPRGITVNCVDPGPCDTGWADSATRARVAARVPGGRWGTPADIAELVAFLASDGAAWITGQVIASDGGWSAL